LQDDVYGTSAQYCHLLVDDRSCGTGATSKAWLYLAASTSPG
jgi:hypothetical protein